MGVRVERTQASSVTSGTSDCTQKRQRDGSSPRARKSVAASKVPRDNRSRSCTEVRAWRSTIKAYNSLESMLSIMERIMPK